MPPYEGRRAPRIAACLLVALFGFAPVPAAETWKIIGWNDLGMHCMDSDYSLFSILPPYNTIHAQVIDPNGNRVVDPLPLGITVTFEAVADAEGSVNTTSAAKTNFWEHVADFFGASPPVDQGLTGTWMPGPANTPQPMHFETTFGWFTAEGIPITPYDDGYRTNPYPMMRLVLRSAQNAVLATTDIVLPVSYEMSCRSCHGSGTSAAARPAAGWAHDPNVDRDYRLNVLALHDEREAGNPVYAASLVAAGHAPAGLYPTAVADGRSILCASCHPSNALPGTGIDPVRPLTEAMHAMHATVVDPRSGATLDASDNRAACYTCHPGASTRCLRGAMGSAMEPDADLAIQCQSCHGTMSVVGRADRVGWLDQPSCQSCHTGTATHNNGQIRYTSVFDDTGQPRVAVDATFATPPDTPAPGFSLYRFSAGHGGLQCEACHGSTHAVYPSSHASDNVQSVAFQGHAGSLVACDACHRETPETFAGGPHGLHPVGQDWVDWHADGVQALGLAACRACHGPDDRGSILSLSQSDQTLTSPFGSRTFWRGSRVSCYACHDGATSESPNPNVRPVAHDTSTATEFGAAVQVSLAASDPDGPLPLALRIVDRPAHGRAGIAGTTATYAPDPGFAGTDHFTFAAWDGEIDSNLATASVTVGRPAAPPPVPDGIGPGDPLVAVKLPGSLVRLEWDERECPSPGYHLVWLDLASLAGYPVQDVECAAGTTGEWVGVPPAGNLGVVVVPDDGLSVEGSHGVDSLGLERASTAAACGFTTKVTDGTCP